MDDFSQLSKRIQALEQQVNDNLKVVPFHTHNGTDSRSVFYRDLMEKRLYIEHTIVGSDAATDSNYGTFWIAPGKGYVYGFKEVHQVAGSDGGAVTLNVEKLTGTTAPDSGVEILSTSLSLKSAANTVQNGTITTTIANYNFDVNDRFCLKDAGTLTAVSNVTILLQVVII